MAMDQNQLIGKTGGMPWYVPGEMTYFKRVTLGKPVIMGRKTFESIGKPLPGRTNIVITQNPQWLANNVLVRHSLDQAVAAAKEVCVSESAPADELFIIGGARVCRDAMDITQRLYLTVIDQAYEGDTWLDSFNWDDWRVVSEDVQDPAHTGGLGVTYWVLEKDIQPVDDIR